MIVIIAGGIGLPYVKPWKLRFGIPPICSVVATLLFFAGWPYYDSDPPKGSPLTTTVRVFVATAHNISQPIPNHKDLYYEDDTLPTSSLRCLDKAAIKLPEGQPPNKWKDCNVHKVEGTKIGIRMLPMWLTFIMVGIVLSIGNTYYLEQANHMDRKLGRIEDKIPMSIFALLPQFMLLAAVDGIADNSIKGFFRNQTPESMHRYLTYFTNGVLGLGSMASVLSISERNGNPNWFQYTLNKSHLDRYYWVLAALSAVNLIIYIIVAYFYKYKESPDGGIDEHIPEGGDLKNDFHDKNCCC